MESWGERRIRWILRRRYSAWMVWIWIPPALVFLVSSIFDLRRGIEVTVRPFMSAMFCVLLALYFFDVRLLQDRVKRVEGENGELREKLGPS